MSTEIQVITETAALIVLEEPALPKALKKLEGSKQENQEVLKKREKKMQQASGVPYGALQAHSLAANLPPLGTVVAPLTLGQHILISGQVEARDVDWYPSKWTAQKSPARGERGNMDTNANL